MLEWGDGECKCLERSAQSGWRRVNSGRSGLQECWIGNARVVGEECKSVKSGMQESTGVQE